MATETDYTVTDYTVLSRGFTLVGGSPNLGDGGGEIRTETTDRNQTLPAPVKARRALLVSVFTLLATCLVACGGTIESAEPELEEDLAAHERTLADLRYDTGARVVFSYDESSGDFGLLQEGRIGESAPLVLGGVESLLEVFLDITPAGTPVPELLLAEQPAGGNLLAEAAGREVSPAPVVAKDLRAPTDTPLSTAASPCFATYYSWWDWHDNAVAGMAPKTYYASSFGGKKRYSDSYVANCTPSNYPDYLWARHRIYYKNAFGNYKKHFEGKVKPWQWQAKHKGSVKRYRKVSYDDNWNSSPSCGGGACKYTREGRFHN